MVKQKVTHGVFLAAAGILTSLVLLRGQKRRRRNVVGWLMMETQVVLIRTSDDLEKWLPRLKSDICSGDLYCGHYILGLDSEWKPEINKGDYNPLSVLQLSGPTITLVIQTRQAIPNEVSESSLSSLLLDEQILKVGMGVHQDVRRLLKDFNLRTRGFLDLNDLSNLVNNTRPGLLNMSSDLLGVEWGGMKGAGENTVTMSDWSTEWLSEDQLYYAASDAFISRKCFFALCDKYVLSEQELEKWVHQHKGAITLQPIKKVEKTRSANKEADEKSKNGVIAKMKKKEKGLVSRTRKGNLYEHCRLLDQSGKILANCNKKKIQWYLNRGLGTLVCKEPLTIKLNFVTNGPGHRGNKFYLEKRRNICVGCGSNKDIARYHVVPTYYRKYFPEFLRSHCSHDIVLLCIRCRMKTKERIMFMKISRETGVPIDIPKFIDYPEIAYAKKAAAVLVRPDVLQRIPPDRQEKLRTTCASYLEKPQDEVTMEDLRNILGLESRVSVRDYVPPGKQIVDKMSIDEVRALIRRWRQFFLDTVEPQHLSKHWSIYAER